MRATKRAIKFWWQRRTRGWDDSDTWSLDITIAQFALPRFRRYMEVNKAIPSVFFLKKNVAGIDWKAAEKRMNKAHSDIEYYLTKKSEDDDALLYTKNGIKKDNRYLAGKKAFFEYFDTFWW